MYKNNRIYFDVVKDGDAEILQPFYNDYDLQAGIESTSNWLMPGTIKEIQELIEGGAFRFIVKTLKDHEPIGFVSVSSNWIVRSFEPMFFINRVHRGKGYGLEVLELVLHIGFMEMNHRKACATVFAFNEPSIKNLRHVGFKEEGRLRGEVFRKGDYWDVFKFGLMIEEWEPKIQRPNMRVPEIEKHGKCERCDCYECTGPDCDNCGTCDDGNNLMIDCSGRKPLTKYQETLKDKDPKVYPCTGCLCQDCPIFKGEAEDPNEPGSFMECEGCKSCVNPEKEKVYECKTLLDYQASLIPKGGIEITKGCHLCACNDCHIPATECDECSSCNKENGLVNFKVLCERKGRV